MTGRCERACVLRLTTDPHELARLYPWLETAAAGFGLPSAMVFGMHVALEEVVANVAMHGFDQGETGEVVVRLDVESGEPVLAVEDDGCPFDMSAADPPAQPARLEDAAPGGRGLRLIRHYCAAVGYERREGRNRLTMRFAAPIAD